MQEVQALAIGIAGNLIASAVVMAVTRMRRWGWQRLRLLLALTIGSLFCATTISSYVALTSVLYAASPPIAGSAIALIALLVLAVSGGLFMRELAKTTGVRCVVARIDALLGQRRDHLPEGGDLSAAFHCVMTGIRAILIEYGMLFAKGRPTVSDHLVRPGKATTDKDTVALAWNLEDALKKHLTAHECFRTAGVLSDEMVNLQHMASDYLWVIDPLDGSRHFLRGLPLFTISVALLKGTERLLGVTYVPVTDELFFAIKGRGAYLNTWADRLRVSDLGLDKAIVHVEFPNERLMKAATDDFINQCSVAEQILSRAHRVRGLGLGSLGLAYVAKASFDAYVTLTGTTLLNDVCAGMLLVEEAGGGVREFDVPGIVGHNIRIVAANERLLAELEPLVTRWKNS